jgi:hypothetical protein
MPYLWTIQEAQLMYVNAPGQNTIARMIIGAKPTTYIHESQTDTDKPYIGAKTPCKND